MDVLSKADVEQNERQLCSMNSSSGRHVPCYIAQEHTDCICACIQRYRHSDTTENDSRDDDEVDARFGVSQPMINSTLWCKENSKALSQHMLLMFTYMYRSDWSGLNTFRRYLKSHNHGSPNCLALSRLMRIEYLAKYRCQSGKAMALFPRLEKLMQRSDISMDLVVRWLSLKASTLEFLGNIEEAQSLREQAAQKSLLLHPNSPVADNMHTYAVHLVTPRKDTLGRIILPDERTFSKAQQYYRWGCELRHMLAVDMDQDYKIPEHVGTVFFLAALIRYIFMVIRSCLGSGFSLFERLVASEDCMSEASQCIEYVEKYMPILPLSAKLEFKVVQCDYFLRKAGMLNVDDKLSYYDKALVCVNSAADSIKDDKNSKLGKSYALYVKWRSNYIHCKRDQLQSTLQIGDYPDSSVPVQDTTPVTDSHRLLSIDPNIVSTKELSSEALISNVMAANSSVSQIHSLQKVTPLTEQTLTTNISDDTESTISCTCSTCNLTVRRSVTVPKHPEPADSRSHLLCDLRLDDNCQTLQKIRELG